MAARVGSGFGWVFMALGAMQVFGGATVNGLWLVLIGWFIRRLAQASVAQLVLDQALRGFTVSELMRTRFEKVPASVTLHQFVDDYLLRSSQQLWPVQDGPTDIGYISLANINLEGQSLQQNTASVRDYMQPLQPDNYLAADISARDAFTRLANHTWPLPVVDDGRVVGIIHQADILRWFSFHKIAP
jgi:CBS domain-containing protein